MVSWILVLCLVLVHVNYGNYDNSGADLLALDGDSMRMADNDGYLFVQGDDDNDNEVNYNWDDSNNQENADDEDDDDDNLHAMKAWSPTSDDDDDDRRSRSRSRKSSSSSSSSSSEEEQKKKTCGRDSVLKVQCKYVRHSRWRAPRKVCTSVCVKIPKKDCSLPKCSKYFKPNKVCKPVPIKYGYQYKVQVQCKCSCVPLPKPTCGKSQYLVFHYGKWICKSIPPLPCRLPKPVCDKYHKFVEKCTDVVIKSGRWGANKVQKQCKCACVPLPKPTCTKYQYLVFHGGKWICKPIPPLPCNPKPTCDKYHQFQEKCSHVAVSGRWGVGKFQKQCKCKCTPLPKPVCTGKYQALELKYANGKYYWVCVNIPPIKCTKPSTCPKGSVPFAHCKDVYFSSGRWKGRYQHQCKCGCKPIPPPPCTPKQHLVWNNYKWACVPIPPLPCPSPKPVCDKYHKFVEKCADVVIKIGRWGANKVQKQCKCSCVPLPKPTCTKYQYLVFHGGKWICKPIPPLPCHPKPTCDKYHQFQEKCSHVAVSGRWGVGKFQKQCKCSCQPLPKPVCTGKYQALELKYANGKYYWVCVNIPPIKCTKPSTCPKGSVPFVHCKDVYFSSGRWKGRYQHQCKCGCKPIPPPPCTPKQHLVWNNYKWACVPIPPLPCPTPKPVCDKYHKFEETCKDVLIKSGRWGVNKVQKQYTCSCVPLPKPTCTKYQYLVFHGGKWICKPIPPLPCHPKPTCDKYHQFEEKCSHVAVSGRWGVGKFQKQCKCACQPLPKPICKGKYQVLELKYANGKYYWVCVDIPPITCTKPSTCPKGSVPFADCRDVYFSSGRWKGRYQHQCKCGCKPIPPPPCTPKQHLVWNNYKWACVPIPPLPCPSPKPVCDKYHKFVEKCADVVIKIGRWGANKVQKQCKCSCVPLPKPTCTKYEYLVFHGGKWICKPIPPLPCNPKPTCDKYHTFEEKCPYVACGGSQYGVGKYQKKCQCKCNPLPKPVCTGKYQALELKYANGKYYWVCVNIPPIKCTKPSTCPKGSVPFAECKDVYFSSGRWKGRYQHVCKCGCKPVPPPQCTDKEYLVWHAYSWICKPIPPLPCNPKPVCDKYHQFEEKCPWVLVQTGPYAHKYQKQCKCGCNPLPKPKCSDCQALEFKYGGGKHYWVCVDIPPIQCTKPTYCKHGERPFKRCAKVVVTTGRWKGRKQEQCKCGCEKIPPPKCTPYTYAKLYCSGSSYDTCAYRCDPIPKLPCPPKKCGYGQRLHQQCKQQLIPHGRWGVGKYQQVCTCNCVPICAHPYQYHNNQCCYYKPKECKQVKKCTARWGNPCYEYHYEEQCTPASYYQCIAPPKY